jgi:hypothetical protein
MAMHASTRSYARVSALVFTVVALLQGWRAARGLTIAIDGWTVPVAASWAACIAAGVLAAWGWRSR